MIDVSKSIMQVIHSIASVNYAGLAYDKKDRGSQEKELSPDMRKLIKSRFRYLNEGDMRKVFVNRTEGIVLKVDKLFQRTYKGYLAKTEAKVYRKFAEKMERLSRGTIRMAHTIQIAPNIVLQEFIRGRSMEWDTDEEYLRDKVKDVSDRCGIRDMHDGNWLVVGRDRAVVIDLACEKHGDDEDGYWN